MTNDPPNTDRPGNVQGSDNGESAGDLGLDDFNQPPGDEGLSLDQLSEAFAEMLDDGDDPYDQHDSVDNGHVAGKPAEDSEASSTFDDPNDPCEVGPRSILEAMLFVGEPDNRPITSETVAGLMRGVRPAEIDQLVRELNEQYLQNGCPYQISSDGAGYRLVLSGAYSHVREKFYGRLREAKLSQAAIDVLSIVAYNQPLTADEVTLLRDKASGPLLLQLVRRQLLKIEREAKSPRIAIYHTTDRFLKLFGLKNLGELPRHQDVEQK